MRFGVLRPRVFGSVVAGTDAEDSDLDLLVDPAPTTTLLTLARLQNPRIASRNSVTGCLTGDVTGEAWSRGF